MQRVIFTIFRSLLILSTFITHLYWEAPLWADDHFGGPPRFNSSNRTWPSQFITPAPQITVYSGPPHPRRDWHDRNRIIIDNRICRAGNSYLAPPHVDIISTKRLGSLSARRFKVTGTVEGICLVDAGLFEDGKKVQNINICTTPELSRFQFTAIVRSDHAPEIRAYNSNGERDSRDALGSGSNIIPRQ